MKRRTAVLGSAAAASLLAGVGAALWRGGTSTQPSPAIGSADIWTLEFEAVPAATSPVRLVRGKPLLVNFWATWCVPCVTEMPLLDRFAREPATAGWRVIALAVDQRDAVRRFLLERGLQLPVALAGAAGIDLSRSLGNRLGALPFTCVFNSAGTASGQHLGAIDEARLESWVLAVK